MKQSTFTNVFSILKEADIDANVSYNDYAEKNPKNCVHQTIYTFVDIAFQFEFVFKDSFWIFAVRHHHFHLFQR